MIVRYLPPGDCCGGSSAISTLTWSRLCSESRCAISLSWPLVRMSIKNIADCNNTDNTLAPLSERLPLSDPLQEKSHLGEEARANPWGATEHGAHNREGKSKAFPAPKRNDLKESDSGDSKVLCARPDLMYSRTLKVLFVRKGYAWQQPGGVIRGKECRLLPHPKPTEMLEQNCVSDTAECGRRRRGFTVWRRASACVSSNGVPAVSHRCRRRVRRQWKDSSGC